LHRLISLVGVVCCSVEGYNGNKVSWCPVLSELISYSPEDWRLIWIRCTKNC